MVFSSSVFLFLFLPIILLIFFILPRKFRKFYLLIASLAFYASTGKKALLILVLITFVNYGFGLLLDRYKKTNHSAIRYLIFTVAIILNLLTLIYIKYFNLFISTVNNLAGLNLTLNADVSVLGISFFVFSALSYVFDINSGKIAAHKNFIDFALYICFFPKLLQGPIARFGHLLPQFDQPQTNLTNFSEGAFRFAQGLAKKVIIADQIGVMVNQVFATPANENSIAVSWIGAIGYALQIYFDFSGYTDMAIGLAKLFGFSLPENFNLPYVSTSITEFWRRWHITLSSWFRDYLFIPLEFKRRRQKFFRTETNILIVFLLTGLWHGAAWNFVIWGLWHGIFISLETFFKSRKINLKLPYTVRLIGTLLIILIGWVIFRSDSLTYASQYLRVMFGLGNAELIGDMLGSLANAKIILVMLIGSITCLPWKSWFPRLEGRIGTTSYQIARTISFVVLMIISIILVLSSTFSPFIYFQF